MARVKIFLVTHISGNKNILLFGQTDQNAVDSVKAGTFIDLRHLITLYNAINCNVQPIYPVISNALVKTKHLY